MAVRKSQIDQIKIKDKTYDINVPKSWAENDPTRVQYIKDRTHYKQLLAGSEIGEIASHSFKNIYTEEGIRIYTDDWRPQQSWIYAGRPCTHTTLNEHLADETCSGGWYNIKVQTIELKDQTATTIDLFEGKIWLEPYQIIGGKANTIQCLVKLTNAGWSNCEVFYHTDGYFYITGEPTVRQADGTYCSDTCTLNISPVATESTESTEIEKTIEKTIEGTPCYRRYLYTYQLDASFIPIDGKTVFLDNNGKLRAEDIYWDNFQVTEQFGRYEPQEWVPAAGRSVRDVLNDAFCADKLPNKLKPSAELFVKAGSDRYEVGTTVEDLSWAIRLKKGSYTYGLVSAEKYPISDTDGSKAFSNYVATDFEITKSIYPNTEEIIFNGLSFELGTNNSLIGEDEDDCRKPNDTDPDYNKPLDYKTLKSGTAKITLPATPITAFTMNLSLNGKVNTNYKASTMLGDISDVCFTEKECKNLTSTTPNILTSDYRWFYGYNKTLEEVRQNPRALDSQLGGFPSSLTTDRLYNAYFIVPTDSVVTGISMTNTTTGAPACMTWQSEEITIKDAGDNEHQYVIYYCENGDEDSGTNTYKIGVIE